MLTRMVLGGKGVPKCPDNTEDVCVCVDQKWFWQKDKMDGVTFRMVLLNGIKILKFKIR